MNLQTLQRQSDDIIHDINNARQQLTFGQDRLKQIIERTLPSIKAELKGVLDHNENCLSVLANVVEDQKSLSCGLLSESDRTESTLV